MLHPLFFLQILIVILTEISFLHANFTEKIKWDFSGQTSSVFAMRDSKESYKDGFLGFIIGGGSRYEGRLGSQRLSYYISEQDFLNSVTSLDISRRSYNLMASHSNQIGPWILDFWYKRSLYQLGANFKEGESRQQFVNRGSRIIAEACLSSKFHGINTSWWVQWRRDRHYGIWDASLYTKHPRVGFEVKIPINKHRTISYETNTQKIHFDNPLLNQYRTQFLLTATEKRFKQFYSANFIYESRESSQNFNEWSLGREASTSIRFIARHYWTPEVSVSCYYNHASRIGGNPVGRLEGIHHLGLSLTWSQGFEVLAHNFRRQVFDDIFDQIMD